MKPVAVGLLELDKKDQKVMAQLFHNGRANYSSIAKRTLLSKDVVQYRISKFVETGLMTNVTTIIDASKFGWQSALVFFKLANLEEAKIKKFIAYLVENPLSVEILEFTGGWDFAARFYYKDIAHLGRIIGELEKEFTGLIADHQIFFIARNIFLPYNVLFPDYAFDFPEKKFGTCKLDGLDLKILSSLSADGRKSLEQLSRELQENRMTIYNRIKKMLACGVIMFFRPNLFTEKLGLHWYWISMRLNDHSDAKIKKIIGSMKRIRAANLVMPGFGFADFVLHVQVKTVQELQKILYELRSEFSGDIKSIESANVIKDYKWDFFPKGFGRYQTRKGGHS